DGWLFYDFRASDPIAYRILGLGDSEMSTRRWFYFVPAAGEPRALVSAVEPNRLDQLPGVREVYRSAAEMESGLRNLLGGAQRVAMDYSPNCAIPYVSRVDAGTIELVRALGVEPVSAADLIQRFEAVLDSEQLVSHRRATLALREIVDQSFAEIARLVRSGERCDELGIQRFVLDAIAAHGLVIEQPPIVAVNAHSALPHFSPTAEDSAAIRRDDFVLLDLWAKEPGPNSIYGDLTWTAFVGDSVPREYAEVFAVVAAARDAAVELIRRRLGSGEPVSGMDADRAAREVIERAGYGSAFVHRTGHSIGREVHGTGANLDSLETLDHRTLIDHTCFSVEPGIYLPGRFGVRSELDVSIEDGVAAISGGPPQQEIIPLMARYR
ncbi:MAG TPA: M24 family metallopeptidase, partial [Candidatus Binataceae bacterium]|nr:M24 family metallopeptidase [Candidatus Binataceae bacterium]